MAKSLYDYCIEQNNSIILEQWDQEKNAPITPQDILCWTTKKFWWRCEKGHEWQASAQYRIKSQCPFCANRRVQPGSNDLATTHPEVAAQWHPTKNGTLTPKNVAAGHILKVWWICDKGHEWQASLVNRTRYESYCPVCAGKVIMPGFNDLASAFPDIAAQWHPQKNAPLVPTQVAPHSTRRAWWICELGHEYQSPIRQRTSGSGCPYCSGKKALPGFNDLATKYPKLAEQWHPELNGELTPEMVTVGSSKRVWWQCPKGHVWKTMIAYRTGKKSGCPYCSGKKALPEFNDLATKYPKLAEQWHPELNGELTPEMVTAGSNKRVWWQCPEGHVWKTMIAYRTTGKKSGCPVCARNAKKHY